MIVETITSLFGKKWLDLLTSKVAELSEGRKSEMEYISNIFGDPISLIRVYVEPDCQTLNPANEDEESPTIVVKSPVIKQLASFIDKPDSDLKDGRQQLIVLADAGMGKTSLLLMLKMTHLSSFWPSEYSCVLLKLGQDSLPDIRKLENKHKTVLLLDALDEDSLAWGNVRERLNELLSATKNFKRVIITCRTQFFPDDEGDPFFRHSQGKIKVGNFVCPMLFLSFFEDKQVEQFVERKYVRLSVKDRGLKLINVQRILANMGSLRFRPLLLAYIDDFSDSDKTSWKESEIFEALISSWLNREARKLDELERNITADMLAGICVQLARLMHDSGARIISEAKLKSHIEANSHLEELNYMDVGGRSLLNRNSNGDFRFSHYSIQEFLLAYGLNRGEFEGEIDTIRYTDKIYSFLIDWLGTDGSISDFDFGPLNFSGANLNQISFSGGKLRNKNYQRCIISEVDFSNCQLVDCDFSSTSILESNFDGAQLSNVNFNSSKITGTNFNNSTLNSSSFYSATIKLAQFVYSKFDNVNFENATINECDFRNTQATDTELWKIAKVESNKMNDIHHE